MCIAKSFCCAAEINTTLQIKYTSIKLEKEKKIVYLLLWNKPPLDFEA